MIQEINPGLMDSVVKSWGSQHKMASSDCAIRLSVIIPCLNVGDWLPYQLEALCKQQCPVAWEVVVVDNGSTDTTMEIADSFRPRLPLLKIVREHKKGQNHARNTGAKTASGDMLIFIDGDDEVEPGCLDAMARALSSHDIVAGRFDHRRLNTQNHGGYGQVQTETLSSGLGFFPFAAGGGLGIRREVFESIGGFDNDIACGEDVDLSWRAQLAGYRIHFEKSAVICIRHRASLFEMYRQHLNFGSSRVQLYRDYAKHGMPRRKPAEILKDWVLILWSLPRLRTHEEKARWVRRVGRCVGYIVGSLRYRVLFL